MHKELYPIHFCSTLTGNNCQYILHNYFQIITVFKLDLYKYTKLFKAAKSIYDCWVDYLLSRERRNLGQWAQYLCSRGIQTNVSLTDGYLFCLHLNTSSEGETTDLSNWYCCQTVLTVRNFCWYLIRICLPVP